MSGVLTTPSAARTRRSVALNGEAPSSPAAQRVRYRRWRDTRLLLGVLLILASVVLGARLIANAGRTNSWLSVTHSLPAGHVLSAADLTTVKAHLPVSSARSYFTVEGSRLAGRVLRRPVAAGELLPADALATNNQVLASRVLPVIVKAGRLPALSPGDHVDVYVLSRGASGEAGREIRVLTDVEFVGQDVLSSGDTSAQLRVSPAQAPSAIAASQSDRVDIVRIDRDSSDQPGEAGPSSVPAFGGG